jgi:hypothetical protein
VWEVYNRQKEAQRLSGGVGIPFAWAHVKLAGLDSRLAQVVFRLWSPQHRLRPFDSL